jgi:serine/threonine protein phosphatase 1
VASFAARDLLGLRRTPKGEPRAVPPDHRVYAVGDIHGRRDLLDRLLREIENDCAGTRQTAVIVFLGDYVDRGPDSKGVIDRLLSLPARFQGKFLRGNHEQALLDFLADPASYEGWCDFGADETLTSYGVRPPRDHSLLTLSDARDRFAQALPANHWYLFRTLLLSWEIGGYFFSHAGVRPGTSLNEQKEDDLLWIREEFLSSSEDFGKIVVHGHTPAESPVKRANRIGVDTGAYLTGHLTAVVLEGDSQRFIQTG